MKKSAFPNRAIYAKPITFLSCGVEHATHNHTPMALIFAILICLHVLFILFSEKKTISNSDKKMVKILAIYFLTLKHHCIHWWLSKVHKNIFQKQLLEWKYCMHVWTNSEGPLKKLNFLTKFNMGNLMAMSTICFYFPLPSNSSQILRKAIYKSSV